MKQAMLLILLLATVLSCARPPSTPPPSPPPVGSTIWVHTRQGTAVDVNADGSIQPKDLWTPCIVGQSRELICDYARSKPAKP